MMWIGSLIGSGMLGWCSNFVAAQVLWTLAFAGFLVVCFCAARVFMRLPVRRLRVMYEVLMCGVIFSYMLAFYVNF